MNRRQRTAVLVASSVLGIGGLTGALVAWVGLDRANAYLGVPAAIAALVGLGMSLYAVLTPESAGSTAQSPLRRVRQTATASDRGRVTQVGGSHGLNIAAADDPPVFEVDQHAKSLGSSHITQIAGDQAPPQE